MKFSPKFNDIYISANYTGLLLNNYTNNVSYFFAQTANSIIYKDIIRPFILEYYNLTNKSDAIFNSNASFHKNNNVSFCINVTDNFAGIENVSVNIITPNETRIYYLLNTTTIPHNTINSTSKWCLNKNFTVTGDYCASFLINDTNNNSIDDNSYYFEVYEDNYINFTNFENINNASLNFKLYLSNTETASANVEVSGTVGPEM